MAKKVILSESGFNTFLLENRNFERAKNAVRRYCNPKDSNDVFSIIHDIQRNIPYSRILKDKYLEGVIRLVYLEELDDSQCETINDILSVINNNTIYQKQFNGNFNDMYFEELYFQFYDEIEMLLSKEREKSANQTYTPNNDYRIYKIDRYEDAMKYAKYTNWCISQSQFDFETYTPHGETFYICLKNGFQDIPKEKGENTPFDEYGLSMIAISVRQNRRLATCTTRWNEALTGGKALTPQQISHLIGRDFYTVFIPNK